MGKKRKFVDVFKTSKCQACALLQNENCPECTSTPQEQTIAQPAKRSLLQQILRHGLNVQTKIAPGSMATSAAQTLGQRTNGLLQHFKLSKFKDGSNYNKGKEIEPFLTETSKPVSVPMETELMNDHIDQLSGSNKSISITANDSISQVEPNDCNVKDASPTISSCGPIPLLRPLFFEVPTAAISSSDSIFIGRNWLFTDIERILFSPGTHKNRGITLTGDEGSGKTSILLQLVENSCFGRRSHQINQPGFGALSFLASKLVAYHFCQVDYRTTCLLPEFVHSIAAQLCQAPQLICYRDFLSENPAVQNILSKLNCLVNPSEAFTKGILEPLHYLQRTAQIPNKTLLLVIDSICEAEYHRTDTGDTISSFLAKHILKFPTWLKVIVTTRSSQQDIASLLPFQEISLAGELQSRDLFEYISQRMKQNPGICSNISGSSAGGQQRFKRYLHKISKGNFLFSKLTLDCIEQGSIQIKSSNFKTLPKDLPELFLLEFNLRFPTLQAFKLVEPILSTCLAALNPLNLLEIYHSINSLDDTENIPWEDFLESIQSLSSFLAPRSDGTYMFFHSSFRDWLMSRDGIPESSKNSKFLCDTRLGHAAISFRLSRIEAPLTPEKTLELGHHILKAHIYKGIPAKNRNSVASRDLQAFWLASSAQDLSETLAHSSNIYYTNFKVTRLLLTAGASPDQITDLFRNAPVLAVAAAEGKTNLVSILLEFGADLDAINLDGDSALHLACEKGHLETVSLLLKHGASLELLNNESQCPFVKAVINSQPTLLKQIFELMDDPSPAIRRALIAICMQESTEDQLDLLDDLLKHFSANLDSPDGICGETPLTAAVRAGRDDVASVILKRGGNPGAPNLTGISPLILAAKQGHRSLAKTLLLSGCSTDIIDSQKLTPLIHAASEGHLDLVDLLISEGADINAEDTNGLNALSWACHRGHSEIAQFVLGHGMDPNHADKLGRTPLDLASHCGSEEIAQLLLDHGALLEKSDMHGVRPLDRAVDNGNIGLVRFFLRSGAKINLTTWTMATGKPEIILVLLNKLMDEGLLLSKNGQLREAVHRFQYTLRKIPLGESGGETMEEFRQIRVNILLQLSHCKRILKEPVEAVNLASESIKLDSNSYKTWFARAKAYHCLRAISEALRDCSRAIDLVTNSEVRKRLLNFKVSIIREGAYGVHPRSISPCQFSTNSLKLIKSSAGNGTGGSKPKASTSNCLSARKSLLI